MITDLQFNKLVDYVKELARQHNELEANVQRLECELHDLDKAKK